MTKEKHTIVHKELHNSLDKLIADYMYHHPGEKISNTTVEDLYVWSSIETILPTGEN